MAESFTISFQGIEEVDSLIWDIKTGFENLDNVVTNEAEEDRWVPEIIVTSGGAEAAIDEFLHDVLLKIQERSTESESEFEEHS